MSNSLKIIKFGQILVYLLWLYEFGVACSYFISKYFGEIISDMTTIYDEIVYDMTPMISYANVTTDDLRWWIFIKEDAVG